MSNIVLYAWRNDDWGAWFYAGIGSKQRAYETDQRSKEFQRIFRNHRCSCHILQEFQEGESDKEITLTEKIVKEILKSFGEPISDGEPEFLRRERQREGIERARLLGIYKGRKPIGIDKAAFDAAYKEVLDGGRTNKWAMEQLGLRPNTYYKAVAKYREEHGLPPLESRNKRGVKKTDV